jgi:hypothetical protein
MAADNGVTMIIVAMKIAPRVIAQGAHAPGSFFLIAIQYNSQQ